MHKISEMYQESVSFETSVLLADSCIFFSLLPGVLRIGDINEHLFLRQFLFFVQITSVSSGCYVILGTLFRRDNSYRGCQQAVNFYGACPVSGAS